MLTKHHRKCRSNGGKSNKRNISYLEHEIHQAWHLIFANRTPEEIADILTRRFIDPDYFIVAIKRR